MALLTGPFLPDLFLSLISIIFLINTIWNKQWIYFNNKFFKLLILFNIYLILISLTSEYPIHSIKSSIFYFRFSVFVIAVAYLLDINKNLLKQFTILFLLSFVIAILDGYYQYFNSTNFFGFISQTETRMTLLLNDKMILGGYLSRLFPLLIGLLIYIYPSNFINLTICSILLIATDILIYITGERTAFGLLLLATVMIIILISKYKLFRIITFSLSIIIILLITLKNPEIRIRNIDHTMNQIGLSGENNIVMFSPVHDSHFRSAIKTFIANPIFGIGPNNFRIFCKQEEFVINDDSCSTHPHNTYIQIISETGIIGFGFLLTIVFYILNTIFKQFFSLIKNKEPTISDFQVCLLACISLSLFPLLPTQNFFNNWINVIYYLPIGFYIFTTKKKNNKISK